MNHDQDIYTLTAPCIGGPFGGLRVETFPDVRLNGGAGLLGEFFLTEIEVAVEAASGSTDRPLAIKDGFVDFYPGRAPLIARIRPR